MASLTTYTETLGEKNARHLMRRATYGNSRTLLETLSQMTPENAFVHLTSSVVQTVEFPFDPLSLGSPDGFWVNSNQNPITFSDQQRKTKIVSGWWWYNAVKSETMHYKMMHFLSTRFTVSKQSLLHSTDFYDYIKLLNHFALGNYKTLAKKMTLNNAMLCYLNNNENTKNAPNENYAREFMELFTIGKGPQIGIGNYTNYTESDVVEAAKVLTGIKNDPLRNTIDAETSIPCGYFTPSDHKTDSKIFSEAFNYHTIAGSNDAAGMNNELDSFINMLFDKVETAKHLCRKLYSYFVSTNLTDEIETDIIIPLAQELINNNYEMFPVLKKLFTSVHFYDLDDASQGDKIIGGLIKSPIEVISDIISILKFPIPNPIINPYEYYILFWNDFIHETYLNNSGMLLFEPINVAGHTAYYQAPDFDKNWISSSTLFSRMMVGESIIAGSNRLNNNEFVYPEPDLAALFSTNFLVSDVTDAFVLSEELCSAFFGQKPSEERYLYFMNSFLLQGQPPGDWSSIWGFYLEANFSSVVNIRLKMLITNILKSPEAQVH